MYVIFQTNFLDLRDPLEIINRQFCCTLSLHSKKYSVELVIEKHEGTDPLPS